MPPSSKLFRVGLLLVSTVSPSLRGQQAVEAPAVPAVKTQLEPNELTPPLHPCTEQQVREYAALTGSDALAHKLMAQILKGMRITGNPAIPPSMWDEMDAEFAKADLLAGAIPAYQRYLSYEDMDAILTFYRSKPGQRILAAQPYIQSASQDAGKKVGQAIGLRAAMNHKEEIEARQKQLDKEASVRAGGLQLNVAPPPADPVTESVKPTDGVKPE